MSALVAAIISGAMALIGVFATRAFDLFSRWLDRDWERQKLLAAKYEELADCLSGVLPWFSTLGSATTLEDIASSPPPPEARRMITLCMLYFPELKDKAAEFSNLLVSYHHMHIDCFRPGFPATAGAQAVRNGGDAYSRLGKEMMRARSELEQAIEKHSKKYT